MNCADVRELLSEYVDGMLGAAPASAVEEHTARCPECRDTLESMSRITTHMNRMEPVDTPDGFLGRVNARIDQRSSFQNLTRRLFVPMRVKLPLELAGVAAAVFLILYVGGFGDRSDVLEIKIEMGIPKEAASDGEPKGKKGGKSDHREKRGENVQALIKSLGGTVTRTEYQGGNDIPTRLTIEIPADAYPTLRRELGRLGVILESPRDYPGKGGETVTIRIEFVYS
jgi:hypothetical protein